jgi:hypothetical protein
MLKSVLPAIVVTLFSFLLSGIASAQSTLTFRMLSEHPDDLEVVFYSDDRKGYQWPPGGRVYELDDSDEVSRFKISCLGGEKICYGAWVADRPRTSWGVGMNRQFSCKNCCYKCNGGETPVITLKWRH